MDVNSKENNELSVKRIKLQEMRDNLYKNSKRYCEKLNGGYLDEQLDGEKLKKMIYEGLGKTFDDGSFSVLGRFSNADVRGCNLLIQ